MLTRIPVAALLLLAAPPLCAQNGWFQPSLLGKPEVRKALQSVDDRGAGIVEEWIRLVETPAPSGKEQAQDAGANDSNIAVSMAIPAVAVGAVVEHMPHRLEEYAEASSIAPGIKSLIALAVALTSH